MVSLGWFDISKLGRCPHCVRKCAAVAALCLAAAGGLRATGDADIVVIALGLVGLCALSLFSVHMLTFAVRMKRALSSLKLPRSYMYRQLASTIVRFVTGGSPY
jgi:hypothetical protein